MRKLYSFLMTTLDGFYELGLKLLQTRTFRSGNVLLTYRPPRRAR